MHRSAGARREFDARDAGSVLEPLQLVEGVGRVSLDVPEVDSTFPDVCA